MRLEWEFSIEITMTLPFEEMPMTRKKKREPEPIYTQLAVCLERYDVEAGVGVNFLLERPELAFHDADDDLVFEPITRLVLTGTATYPSDRAGEGFELTIRGDDGPSTRVGLKLREMQVRDNHVPRYREYRGQTFPVYRHVPGVASMTRARKTSPWTAWINLAPRLVSDMLALLGMQGRLYLAILESRRGRERWIRQLSLQTRDPASE
jgi:hypothetical protein